MSTLTFPYTFASGALADANQVNSDFAAVGTVVNGNLEASTNVKVGAPVAQTSAALNAGVSLNLARSDHAHTIQCTEQLAADPGSANFIGRRYFNTSTLKERLCIATGGGGTWVTMGNYAGSDLPAHASNHTTGSDLLNPPSCMALRTANQSIPNSSNGIVAFNGTDVWDTDSMHDPVTNNSRITFNHAGVYDFFAIGYWAPSNVGTRKGAVVLNAATALSEDFDNAPAGASACITTVKGKYKFAAADFIEFWVFQTSGSALNFTNSGNFVPNAGILFGAQWTGTGN